MCGKKQDGNKLKKFITAGEIMRCSECKTGPVKPDIVFFGEGLPKDFFTA
jgi:NAD-dependent SIR2 family protein deacetylase